MNVEPSFSKEFAEKMKTHVTVFDGMREIVVTLAATYTLLIISSNNTLSVEEFLDVQALAGNFDWVLGAEVHTSKVEKIRMVFEKYQTSADNCVFVTDTLGDIREAAKLDVGAVGVSWGVHTQETLALGNPFRLIENPADIPEAVSAYFTSKK